MTDTLDSWTEELRRTTTRPLVVHGPTKLAGILEVQGSKNAILRMVPAAIAVPGVYRFHRVPLVIDLLEMLQLVRWLGATVHLDGARHSCYVDTRSVRSDALT